MEMSQRPKVSLYIVYIYCRKLEQTMMKGRPMYDYTNSSIIFHTFRRTATVQSAVDLDHVLHNFRVAIQNTVTNN